jgi:transcriptional regulator with XRE-family HTH domain
MNNLFFSRLKQLRTSAKLTNSELARAAGVPTSLISGLEKGYRRIGEYQALKIGRALKLSGDDLEAFVFSAIDTSTERVLNEVKNYPSLLLNHLPLQLNRAGIPAEAIDECTIADSHVILTLADGNKARLQCTIIRG